MSNYAEFMHQKMMASMSQQTRQCYCIGPKNGEPVCPCAMKAVIVKNGRYLMVKDLGPVVEDADRQDLAELVSWGQREMAEEE